MDAKVGCWAWMCVDYEMGEGTEWEWCERKCERENAEEWMSDKITEIRRVFLSFSPIFHISHLPLSSSHVQSRFLKWFNPCFRSLLSSASFHPFHSSHFFSFIVLYTYIRLFSVFLILPPVSRRIFYFPLHIPSPPPLPLSPSPSQTNCTQSQSIRSLTASRWFSNKKCWCGIFGHGH